MRIDFHVHTARSLKTGFQPDALEPIIHQAQKSNLDALVLTDYWYLTNWPDIFAYLDDTCEYRKPCYQTGNICLIPGMEIVLLEGPHILVTASRGHIRRLYETLKDKTDGILPDVKTLIDACQDLHVITAVAHPLKPGAELSRLHKSQRNRFDALEVNGNTVTKLNPEGIAVLVHKLAARYKLSVIAGSDSHGPENRLGSVATILPREFHSISDLHTMILAQQHSLEIS